MCECVCESVRVGESEGVREVVWRKPPSHTAREKRAQIHWLVCCTSRKRDDSLCLIDALHNASVSNLGLGGDRHQLTNQSFNVVHCG